MQWARTQHQTVQRLKTLFVSSHLLVATAVITVVVAGLLPQVATAATPTATWSKDGKSITYGGKKYTGPHSSFNTVSNTSTVSYSLGSGCSNAIIFTGNGAINDGHDAKQATYAIYKQSGGTLIAGSGCQISSKKTIGITPYKSSGNTATTVTPGDPSGGNGGSTATASGDVGTSSDIDPCDASGDPLTWIVCPIVGMLHEATNLMQSVIDHLMTIDVKSVFDKSQKGSTGQAYYAAWNSFRIFGVALIVIAGLVMVISEAMGMEIFDAYTVKKVLPRLFVAVIGISLSWWIMQFLVEITDDIGITIRSIIYAPFKGLANQYGGMQDWGSMLFTLLVGAGGLFFMTIGGVLSLLATAALAALIAFLVLVIRQIVITFLIIIAPLAIACYVLPNTQKAFHMWWESLSKGLLMFPIISAFIATGQVFSVVATGDPQKTFSINHVVGLIAYFLPYFALPFTFRLAGGALATLGGLVNDRSRGGFDRLKKFRQQGMARKHQMRMEGETRFGSTKAGSLYRRTALLGDPNSGAASLSRAGRAKFRETERKMLARHSDEMLKNDNMRAAGDDDAMEIAQTAHNGREFVQQYSKRVFDAEQKLAVREGRAMKFDKNGADQMAYESLGLTESSFGARMGTNAMKVAAFKAQQSSVTGYKDTDEEYLRRFQDAGKMVAAGLMTESDAMATIKQNKARVEASGTSFGVGMTKIRDAARGKTLDTRDLEDMMDSTLEGLTPGSLIGARKEAGAMIGRHQMRQLNEAVAAAGGNLNDQKVKRVMGRIAGLRDVINSQAPQMAEKFADDLMGQTISGTSIRVRDFEDQLRALQDSDFNDVRKEWLTGVPPGTMPGASPPPGAPGGGSGPGTP